MATEDYIKQAEKLRLIETLKEQKKLKEEL
jgi:hypothetical protein